jgi:hypothetical protein
MSIPPPLMQLLVHREFVKIKLYYLIQMFSGKIRWGPRFGHVGPALSTATPSITMRVDALQLSELVNGKKCKQCVMRPNLSPASKLRRLRQLAWIPGEWLPRLIGFAVEHDKYFLVVSSLFAAARLHLGCFATVK